MFGMSYRTFIHVTVSTILAAAACCSAAITLVNQGQSPYSIVLSAQASASEKRGAAELAMHIRQMSGAQLPIVTDDGPLPEAAVIVGANRHTEPADAGLEPDGFRLHTRDRRIFIVGSRVRGTMYGCTELLERLGVRWYTPKVTFIPRKATIEVPELDLRQIPAFEYREAFFTEAFGDKDWAARMRFNGNSCRLDESTGGKITYHPFVHSFDDLIPLSLYKEHPEYFPLIKGKRADGYRQRCLSNPDVLKLAIDKVRQWIRERPAATIYSVSQNDCYETCECDACKQIMDRYGGVHSGLYLWFVNQIAEAIEKDHPDKLIDTLAYQFTEAAPTGIVPRKNVRIRLCPISACEAHPYEKCSHPNTVRFVKNLAAWAKITDTLYIWHYNTNFANYLMPFPDFEEFPADTRLYQRSGVKGIFFQGAYAGGGGGSDAELRSYVMSRLLWDPSADSDALVTEWMKGVYGAAWQPMRQWFDLLHEKARNPEKHFFIFDPPTVHYLSPDVLAAGDGFFDQAQKLADSDLAREYVAKSRLWLRYVKLSQSPAVGPELDAFLADVRGFGITQLREGQPLDRWEAEYRRRAERK